MVREYRIRIDQYIVFLTLAALEFQLDLLRRAILTAKETFASGNILLCQFRCRRNHSGRIELNLHRQSSHLKVLHPHILQCTEIITRQRPAGKLVTYEFMYPVLLHFFIRAASSQVRMRSLYRLFAFTLSISNAASELPSQRRQQ